MHIYLVIIIIIKKIKYTLILINPQYKNFPIGLPGHETSFMTYYYIKNDNKYINFKLFNSEVELIIMIIL